MATPSSSCSSPSISPKKKKTEAVTAEESDWLSKFCIRATRWEPDVEQGLTKGSLTPLQKNALMRQLCTSIMAYTSYPTVDERTHIALQLVLKYPFLKGSFGAGHQIWVKKIQERFANVKKRLAKFEKKRLEAEGVVVTKGKPGRKRKQPKNSIVPDIPEGETEETMEAHRKKLVDMFRKGGTHDLVQVKNLMDNTYAKRRRDVLLKNTRVWKLLQDYPFLKDDKGIQMKAELARIEDKQNVAKEIKEIWEFKKPQILKALKKSQIRAVNNILVKLDDCELSDEKELENRCIIAALPFALGEKSTYKHTAGELFWEAVLDDSEVDATAKIKACSTPRLLATGSIEEITSLALVAEGGVVIKFRSNNIINAITCLLSSYYVFNAEYPKGPTGHSKNIYLFLEHILLGRMGQSLPIGVENFLSQL